MFLESLIETSRDTRARRGFATFVSFALEGVAVGALVLVPLIYTQALPGLRFSEPVPPPPAPRPRVQGVRTTLVKVPPALQNDDVFRAPMEIPRGIYIPKEPEVRASDIGGDDEVCVGCVPFGTGERNATARNTWASLFKPPEVAATTRDTVQKMLRISHMDPGMLIHRVDPQYPPIARITRTQGEVVLAAVIGRDGRIENLRTVSGHPYLVPAAVQAVQQWRYRPTMLNGQPVEVETQVTVRFTLAQ